MGVSLWVIESRNKTRAPIVTCGIGTMTIHSSYRHHSDDAPPTPRPAGSAVTGHVIVAGAIALVAAATAAFLGLELKLEPIVAAAAGFGVMAVAGLVHIAVARGSRLGLVQPSPTRHGQSADRRLPAEHARDLRSLHQSVPLSPAPEPAAPATAAPVEPSDLALTLLARVAPAAPSPAPAPPEPVRAPEPADWMRALAANAPPPLATAGELAAPVVPSAGSLSALDLHGGRFDAVLARAIAEVTPPPPVPAVVAEITPPAARLDAPSTVESDYERVDRLVRRLADQVNRLDAAPLAPALPGFDQLSLFPDEDQASLQLAQSISALRRGAIDEAVTHAAPLAALQEPPAMPPAHDAAPAGPALAPPPAPVWSRPVQARQDTAAETERAAILAAINAQRIDVFLEPILDLADQRPQHYEVSIGLRTVSGATINLAQAANDLSGTGLLPLIDQTRIARAVQMARRLAERGKVGSVFTGLNGETLDDGAFQDTFTGNLNVGAFPGQMVLTLQQDHVRLFTAADWQTLARLRAAGFAFALCDVTSLDMDFAALASFGFTFARLDAETFLIGLPLGEATVPPPDICRHMAQCGLTLIVGGILDDSQLLRIFGFGVLFGQGQLFGGARPVKAAAAAHAAVAAE